MTRELLIVCCLISVTNRILSGNRDTGSAIHALQPTIIVNVNSRDTQIIPNPRVSIIFNS
jgi:hypothetical protein